MTTHARLSAVTLGALLAASLWSGLPVTAQEAGTEPPPPPAADAPRGPMLFDMVDADGDGTATAEEIRAFRSAGVAGADSNGDGRLSAEELAARDLVQLQRMATLRATRTIAEFDLDGDGLLTVEELSARPLPDFRLGRLDADGDGAITRAEAEAAQGRHGFGRGDRDGRGDRHGGGHHGKGGAGRMAPGAGTDNG